MVFSDLSYYLRSEKWKGELSNDRLVRIITETNKFCQGKKALRSSSYRRCFNSSDARLQFLQQNFPERCQASSGGDDSPEIEFDDDDETKKCSHCAKLPPHQRCVRVIQVKSKPDAKKYQGDVLTCAPSDDYPLPVSPNRSFSPAINP